VIYDFDEADEALTLLPMASRRALDRAGLKLSLAAYQTLPLSDRRRLVQLGAADEVELEEVCALAFTASPPPAPQPALREPESLPQQLAAELGPDRELDAARWQRFTGLDRYVLDKLQRRGKRARLLAAFDEIARRRG
jgi:hypothetical protein